MGWGKGLSENGESYRKIGYGIMFIVLLSLLSLDCHRPPPENEQQYDPRNISRTETQSVGPSIALSPDGTVYVVWMDGSESGYEPFHIYFKYKSVDNGWSEPEVISDITTDSWEPHAIVDPFGNLHVVWREQDPDITKAKIYYRMRSSTGEWSDIGVLSREGALQPRIAVDPSGTVHVVWSAGALWYTYKPPEGGWATPREVVPFAIAGDNPCLTVDSDGNCHLVYEYSGEIYYVTGSPTGEWSEPFNVSQSKYTSWLGHVTVDEEGRVYVLWTEEDWGAGPQTSIIYYSVKTDTGWTAPDSIPGTRGVHGWPRGKKLFFKGNKKYLLWGDGWYEIYLGYTEGSLSNSLKITEPIDPPESPYPVGVMDSMGRIHVVWSPKEADGNWEIYYQVIGG